MKKVIGTFIILTTISLNIMAQQKIVQTAGLPTLPLRFLAKTHPTSGWSL